IGNPPLGHSGEESIREWFLQSETAKVLKRNFTPAQCADIGRYEGNAQGFRVLARLQMPDNPGGMQLTCATLGAFVKYPVEATVPSMSDRPPCFAKKFNFFQHDKALFAAVAAETGLLALSSSPAIWVRHPLAFLVEAADDICYTIIDFEDGHRLGIISYPELEAAFLAVIGAERAAYCRDRAADMRENQRKAEFLRAMALNALVQQLVAQFVAREEDILRGDFTAALTKTIPAAAALQAIQERSFADIYTYRRAVEIEVAGYELAAGLLDVFVRSVNDVAENGMAGASGYHRKICLLLPEKFRPDWDPSWRGDAYLRLLNVLDFICGMTDSYAVNLYKKIKGISLPGQ
ncbi:MAG: dNTP triphosphohydrolase, partial [Victivallales bacterium]|nr:dNTP triphosphohydrolase [Victivallales bacterium]